MHNIYHSLKFNSLLSSYESSFGYRHLVISLVMERKGNSTEVRQIPPDTPCILSKLIFI